MQQDTTPPKRRYRRTPRTPPKIPTHACPTCNGRGRIRRGAAMSEECVDCGGTGEKGIVQEVVNEGP